MPGQPGPCGQQPQYGAGHRRRWIETNGGASVCLGFGELQEQNLHITVSCGGKDFSATASKTSDGQGVDLAWGDGSTDSLS